MHDRAGRAVTVPARTAVVAPLVPAALVATAGVAVAPLGRRSSPRASPPCAGNRPARGRRGTRRVTAVATERATITVAPGPTASPPAQVARRNPPRSPGAPPGLPSPPRSRSPRNPPHHGVAVAEPAPIAAPIAVAVVAEATAAAAPALLEATTRARHGRSHRRDGSCAADRRPRTGRRGRTHRKGRDRTRT